MSVRPSWLLAVCLAMSGSVVAQTQDLAQSSAWLLTDMRAGALQQTSPQQQEAPPARPAPTPELGPVPSRPAPNPDGSTEARPRPTVMPRDALIPARPAYLKPGEEYDDRFLGSTYVSVDSWVYPALMRLNGMGFVDTAFTGMRPWTRRSILHMLLQSQDAIMASSNDEAKDIYAKVMEFVEAEGIPARTAKGRGLVYGTESAYARAMGISGLPLRDSFYIGQTIGNDYGRPYQGGFNLYSGASTVTELGPFSLHIRGEYQHSPSAAGYSTALAQRFSIQDQIPYEGANLNQATIPLGPISSQNNFRLLEASLSVHLLGHEISGGKMDNWMGQGLGGALAWSNNAENIYAFRINRVEPLYIPYVSKVTGPLRYDFFLGSLKGHTYPNHPWVHAEMFAFKPSKNFEFGFQRTVIWGGKDHAPVTIHTFLRSFFSISDTTGSEKYSREDPGARFSSFNFAWRLPYLTNWLTLYTDSMVHDDVTPVSAPRRSAFRSGLYLSHFPGAPKLDLRVEGVNTDPPVRPSNAGQFIYWETIQRQGYTNKGFLMGDWTGRESKGGQAMLGYHLSGNEVVQVEYRNRKSPNDFIPGGMTQNSIRFGVVKRLGRDVELNAFLQREWWKAPVYKTGQQTNTTTNFQVTWFPKLHNTAVE